MTDSPSQMHLLGPMVMTVLVLTAEPLRLMRKLTAVTGDVGPHGRLTPAAHI